MKTTLQDKVADWVSRYTDEMYKYTFSQVGNHEFAEDIVQNVFVAAWENHDKLEGIESPKSWLFSVLRNKISDHFRTKYKNREDTNLFNENQTEDIHFDNLGEWNDNSYKIWDLDQDSLLDNAEFKRILNSCLEALPEKWNAAIKLKFLEQQDGNKISSNLRISSQNFWQVIHRAKLQLRDCLDNNWFDE